MCGSAREGKRRGVGAASSFDAAAAHRRSQHARVRAVLSVALRRARQPDTTADAALVHAIAKLPQESWLVVLRLLPCWRLRHWR